MHTLVLDGVYPGSLHHPGEFVALPPLETEDEAEQLAAAAVPASPSSYDSSAARSDSLARRIAWADLLKRVFEVDALRCPGCGGRMRLMAAITDASIAGRILQSLALPPRAPPLAPAKEIITGPVVGDGAIESAGTHGCDDPEKDDPVGIGRSGGSGSAGKFEFAPRTGQFT